MDVKEGDNVLVECRVVQVVPHDAAAENCSIRVATLSGGIWIHRSEIKSVEPAPPAVGDIITYDAAGCEGVIRAAHGGLAWVSWDSGDRNIIEVLPALKKLPGFRIVKRAEPK